MTRDKTFEVVDSYRQFGPGDVLVLFGELFGRGYATGLRDAAKSAGMTIIGSTMGRPDPAGTIRALAQDELIEAEAHLGGRIINIPLVAGFDQDAPRQAPSPSEQLHGLTLDNWRDYKLNWDLVAESRALGAARFLGATQIFVAEVSRLIPPGANVIFAHTMAGGLPRHKVFMALINRVYKGRGHRHLSSQALMDSDLGKLALMSFDEVTADSFRHLVSASAPFRAQVEAEGGQVSYTAYGYHGTRVLIGNEYLWQTYPTYTQGFAKLRLEQHSQDARAAGIRATVFNCPEIRTNSSDVFAGLELSLVPLLAALRKEGGGGWVEKLYRECQALLLEDVLIDDVIDIVMSYLRDEVMAPYADFSAWPMQNSAAQAEKTIGMSQRIVAMHKSPKRLIGDILSTHVVRATGNMILTAAAATNDPVIWLDHDDVSRVRLMKKLLN